MQRFPVIITDVYKRQIITLSDYLFFLKEDGVKFYDGYVVNGTEDSKKMDTSGNVSRTFGEGISSFGNSGYNTDVYKRQDYTYTIDATHFSFTYTGTGLSSSGTYVIDGDKLIFSEENDVN